MSIDRRLGTVARAAGTLRRILGVSNFNSDFITCPTKFSGRIDSNFCRCRFKEIATHLLERERVWTMLQKSHDVTKPPRHRAVRRITRQICLVTSSHVRDVDSAWGSIKTGSIGNEISSNSNLRPDLL